MADKKPLKTVPDQSRQMPSNVTPIKAEKCVAEDCKKNPERANFCQEHYIWFKEGLLTIDGYHARDFDKKFHAYQRRLQKAA